MATMRDVAVLAGVSTATVSHVVNGTKKISPETTERVLMAIAQVKYTPNTVAKSLRSGQTNTIGVLVEDIATRGIGQERYNGRQKYWQDNKSLAHLRSYCDQQRKLLAELRLTPNGRRAESIDIDDDFDSFPD